MAERIPAVVLDAKAAGADGRILLERVIACRWGGSIICLSERRLTHGAVYGAELGATDKEKDAYNVTQCVLML